MSDCAADDIGPEKKMSANARLLAFPAVLLLVIVCPGCRGEQPDGPAQPKSAWATPVERPGCPNLHKVDENLYRGAQPTAEGFVQLKKLGIRTVINLRLFHSDRSKIGDMGLAYEHIYVKAWHPEDEDVVRFLQIVTDPKRTPAFVHCNYGSDRTGMMVAIYRVAVCGWTKDEAIREMIEGGFGYHSVWGNLTEYLDELDVTDIRKRAGLTKPEVPHAE